MSGLKESFVKILKNNRAFAGGMLLGICSFLLLYGIRILNVTYDDWLLTGGDLSQHYLGWCFFRTSDWAFPIGLMDRISYPNHVSVIFTDSIPLFAIIFKLFRSWLPETFQYFGIWGLLCFALQGGLGALLIRHFVKKDGYAIVGSLFFVLAPIEIYRMYMHTALGAQWLLLAALLLGLERSRISLKNKVMITAILGFLCGSIHMYFIPMCGIILCAFWIEDVIYQRKILPAILQGGAYCVFAVAAVVLLGGLSHDHQLDAGGLGQFSFNLNGLVNPQGWSRLLPDLPLYGDGAGEGLAFPGLGILTILLISVILLIFCKKSRLAVRERINRNNWIAYSIIIVVSAVISVSHRLALGGQVIWEIPYPEWLVSLWGMFRSSGRFIWPVVYLLIMAAVVLLFVALAGLDKKTGTDKKITDKMDHGKKIQHLFNCNAIHGVALMLLVTLLGLQIFDCYPQLKERHDRFSSKTEYVSVLKNEIWQELAGKEHIVFVSDIINNQDLLYGLSVYALKNDMTINNFYFAHYALRREIEENIESSLASPDKNTIYIYKESDEGLCTDERMEYRKADGLIIGVLK